MLKKFISDIDKGLSQPKKNIPSKYFYDKTGDEIFIKIMALPEYYLSTAEIEIFTQQIDKIINNLQLSKTKYFELIELGAGDGTKIKRFLQVLQNKNYKYDYIPIDISKNILNKLKKNLQKELPTVSIKPKHGDYFNILKSLKDNHHQKVLLLLGSNIGNMQDEISSKFIYDLGKNLNKNDKFIIGADLIKSADIIIPAYNDSKGITKSFNMNVLTRINQKLGANFNLNNFKHIPKYCETTGVASSYLMSTCKQEVMIKAIGKSYQFNAKEMIHTEISRKYNDDIINAILSKTDFSVINKLTDSKNYFADYILNRL